VVEFPALAALEWRCATKRGGVTHADGMATTDAAAIARGIDVGRLLLLRWLATWIDLVFLAVVLLTPIYAFNQTPLEFLIFVAMIVFVVYYPITEGIWGQTLGKLATGLIVVDRYGRLPGLGRALLRTLVRTLEVNPFLFGGVPAGIAVLATKDRQRLGDLAAGTYVVPLSALRAAATPAAPIANIFT
jgi:uncharacterized RDD family membrane protein YckC